MDSTNLHLVSAFPSNLRIDALFLASALPTSKLGSHSFQVNVNEETLQIPYRIYHDHTQIETAHLSAIQSQMLSCLLTRHHNGFIREEHSSRILDVHEKWIAPFVVQLVGEYVFEITRLIKSKISSLDSDLYRIFLQQNPAFLQITKQRALSYWDCYHRGQKRDDYPAFQILNYFDQLLQDHAS